MWQRALTVSGGGVVSIKANSSDYLGEINAYSQSFTAPKNCIMKGYIEKGGNCGSADQVRLMIDGTDNDDLITLIGQSAPINALVIYGTGSASFVTPYGVFIPEGSTVYAGDKGNFDLKFYGCL